MILNKYEKIIFCGNDFYNDFKNLLNIYIKNKNKYDKT